MASSLRRARRNHIHSSGSSSTNRCTLKGSIMLGLLGHTARLVRRTGAGSRARLAGRLATGPTGWLLTDAFIFQRLFQSFFELHLLLGAEAVELLLAIVVGVLAHTRSEFLGALALRLALGEDTGIQAGLDRVGGGQSARSERATGSLGRPTSSQEQDEKGAEDNVHHREADNERIVYVCEVLLAFARPITTMRCRRMRNSLARSRSSQYVTDAWTFL
jgi:hypothetical protein